MNSKISKRVFYSALNTVSRAISSNPSVSRRYPALKLSQPGLDRSDRRRFRYFHPDHPQRK